MAGLDRMFGVSAFLIRDGDVVDFDSLVGVSASLFRDGDVVSFHSLVGVSTSLSRQGDRFGLQDTAAALDVFVYWMDSCFISCWSC